MLSGNEKDNLLWRQFRNGDKESFVSLFWEYDLALFNFGIKFTKDQALFEDCIQELFIDIWRSNGKAEINSVKAYFFSAFKFKLKRALSRTEKWEKTGDEIKDEFEISHDNILISNQLNEELNQKVICAIQELSPRQKEGIYLKFHHDLKYEEISEIMNINYQAARNLIYQSIKSLKKIILHLLFVFIVMHLARS